LEVPAGLCWKPQLGGGKGGIKTQKAEKRKGKEEKNGRLGRTGRRNTKKNNIGDKLGHGGKAETFLAR